MSHHAHFLTKGRISRVEMKRVATTVDGKEAVRVESIGSTWVRGPPGLIRDVRNDTNGGTVDLKLDTGSSVRTQRTLALTPIRVVTFPFPTMNVHVLMRDDAGDEIQCDVTDDYVIGQKYYTFQYCVHLSRERSFCGADYIVIYSFCNPPPPTDD